MANELFLPEDSWFSQLRDWAGEYRLQLVAGSGALLLIFGAITFFSGVFEPAKIEVLESSNIKTVSTDKVKVEIAGSVIKPGVYELLASDRVERLLIASGGLSAEADRAWVEKNINQAAKVVDGQKLYIPKEGEINQVVSGSGNQGSGVLGISTLINLNTATVRELDSLPGIGAVRANAIVENRPYMSVDELVSKKVLSKKLFEEIKGQITAP